MNHRILIADDDQISRRLAKVTLEAAGLASTLACDGEEAWAAMVGPARPQLLILDWNMPGFGGPEICRKVRALGAEPYTYMLILSSRHAREDVAQALQAGADDYVAKPFYGPELIERVKAGLRILDLQRSFHAVQEELRVRATRDALTGLWNRGAILECLQAEVARAGRTGAPLSVAVVDVDHFKRLNDTRGHAFGDQVLADVSAILEGAVRSYDSVGRHGGEEFLVVLPGCDAPAAALVAERLRAKVAAHDHGGMTATVSIGVASTQGGLDAKAVVHEADVALFRAKRGGRNRVEVAAGEAARTAESTTSELQ